jgi:hypothetical protein
LVVVDDIFTALNKIVASDRVAGGLQIYVKTAFRNGPDLEVSSFQCGKHGDDGHPGFEEFAPQATEDLHEKWKAYSATVLEGISISCLIAKCLTSLPEQRRAVTIEYKDGKPIFPDVEDACLEAAVDAYLVALYNGKSWSLFGKGSDHRS